MKNSSMKNKKKVYLCNRKRCGSKCTYPVCKATTNEDYAVDISIPFEVYEPTGALIQKGCLDG